MLIKNFKYSVDTLYKDIIMERWKNGWRIKNG